MLHWTDLQLETAAALAVSSDLFGKIPESLFSLASVPRAFNKNRIEKRQSKDKEVDGSWMAWRTERVHSPPNWATARPVIDLVAVSA
jgi:hypothetical protein